MKKIITFLFAIGTITIASAQSSRRYAEPSRRDDQRSKDVVYNRPQNDVRDNRSSTHDRSDYNITARERDEQVQRIQREYAERISEVKRARRLRAGERNAQVRLLERQRDERIKDVQARFSSSNNQHRDNAYIKDSRSRW